jgi:predicted site-specific integrase-resolvase
MPYSTSSNTETEWIKVTQAAAVIGINPRTIRTMLKDGRLKVRTMQFDQATRIHRGDWEKELAKRVSEPVSA